MKQLKYLLLILPFLFIGSVKADSLEVTYGFRTVDFAVSDYNEFITFLEDNDKIISNLYSSLFESYYNDYSSQYPYYIITFNYFYDNISLDMTAVSSPFYLKISDSTLIYLENGETLKYENHIVLNTQYSFKTNTYFLPTIHDFGGNPVRTLIYDSLFNECHLMDSNFDVKIYTDYDNIIIHNFRNTNSDFIINSGDVYQTLYKSGVSVNKHLVEVNLNDYSYVALSLKDYKQDPFSTEVYAKGNYCITPVYNYGMTERNEILSSTKVERCSPYYETYTPIRTYILDSDLKNNAIYYLKAYDTSKDNYVKIDTSIFDITYITEENKDNPYVTIGGKSYPTLSYDSLTDTATKSEDEGYVSGAVEEFSFTDIFTAPLEFLEDLWDSIKSVFSLIKELFLLLPEPLPTFLIISFTLAIVLGLLKIIL